MICYTKVPREVIDSKTLSARAKIIYEYFLTLFEMSKKHTDQFQDEKGIYICCAREKLMEKFSCAKGTIIKAIKELKTQNFIEEVRQGQGKVNKIYLKDLFLDSKKSKNCISKSSKKETSKSLKSELQEVQKLTPNNINHYNTIDFNIQNNNISTTTQKDHNTIINCCSDDTLCQIIKRLETYNLSSVIPTDYDKDDLEMRNFMLEDSARYFQNKENKNVAVWLGHYVGFMEWGLVYLVCYDIRMTHESWDKAQEMLETLLDMGIDSLNKWRFYIGLPEIKEHETLLEKVSRLFTEYFSKKPNKTVMERLNYFLNHSMEFEVILDAFDIALGKNKEWDYARGVLNNRLSRGILTIKDVITDDRERSMI